MKIKISILILYSIIYPIFYCHTKFNQDEIISFLEKNLKNKRVCMVPSSGNAGDSLIWYGTVCLLKKLNIDFFQPKNEKEILDPLNDIVLYGGGGGFVPHFNTSPNFLKNYMFKVKKLILLPQTIYKLDNLFKICSPNVTIFCRDLRSFNYCKEILPNKENIFFSMDMAFYSDLSSYKTNNLNNKKLIELFAFRKDKEANNERNKIILPKSNIDISSKWSTNIYSSIDQNMKVVNNFINSIAPYDIIYTDRLHVGIAGFLLDKKVHLFDNSYGKNRAIYESTIQYLDKNKNVTFHGTDFSILKDK